MEFSHPLLLFAILIIPLAWLLFYQMKFSSPALEKFIDAHLLPYLLIGPLSRSPVKSLLLWSFVWACLTIALAGPRWDYREVETFVPDQNLVIVLDLSESMNAKDIKPSRLIRAKQKIEDILNDSKGIKIGLIAFAADPHMIVPLTDDTETVRHLLQSLDTSVVYVQGSRLGSALEMAGRLLEKEQNKAVLVISDGGFEDTSQAIGFSKKLKQQGIKLYAMGMGTDEGAPVKGSKTLSKLEKDKLKALGTYLEPHEELVLETGIAGSKKQKIWEEHFYLFLLPALPILLWWMRKGYLIPLFLLFFIPSEAYFKNSEELGVEAVLEGNYEKALQTLQDPYRKGVAAYKAGHFEEAESLFRNSTRAEVALSAQYNLGNALAQSGKLKEAISAYEEVLIKDPSHIRAKENIELLKKMLEEEKQNQEENKDQQEQSQENKDQEEKQDQGQGNDSEGQEEENKDSDPEQEQNSEATSHQKEETSEQAKREEEQNADLWLNQIASDPKDFLKNKFYIESKQNHTQAGIDPW